VGGVGPTGSPGINPGTARKTRARPRAHSAKRTTCAVCCMPSLSAFCVRAWDARHTTQAGAPCRAPKPKRKEFQFKCTRENTRRARLPRLVWASTATATRRHTRGYHTAACCMRFTTAHTRRYYTHVQVRSSSRRTHFNMYTCMYMAYPYHVYIYEGWRLLSTSLSARKAKIRLEVGHRAIIIIPSGKEEGGHARQMRRSFHTHTHTNIYRGVQGCGITHTKRAVEVVYSNGSKAIYLIMGVESKANSMEQSM